LGLFAVTGATGREQDVQPKAEEVRRVIVSMTARRIR